jgi:hypothetical protein
MAVLALRLRRHGGAWLILYESITSATLLVKLTITSALVGT